MTKGEAKAAALRWLDEATVGGRAADSDELADYQNRMDTLIDGALRQLAVRFPLENVWETKAAEEVTLPEDFYALETVLCRGSDEDWRECSEARRVGKKVFLLPKDAAETLRFYYQRLPQSVKPDAEDDTMLDVAAGAEDLLALRLAADALAGMEEKSAAYARLDARFQSAALERMTQDHRRIRIETRYGGLE